MLVSAEIRWFWETEPTEVKDWFLGKEHQIAAGGGTERTDTYLLDTTQAELGIKKRGKNDGVEIKGLVAGRWAELRCDPFVGPVELWTKWSSEPLVLDNFQTIAVRKLRWQRKFDTTGHVPVEIPLGKDEKPVDANGNKIEHAVLPAHGCNIELTQVWAGSGKPWWTFGFEAFGTLQTLENTLQTVASLLVMRGAKPLSPGQLDSYPSWLRKNVARLQ